MAISEYAYMLRYVVQPGHMEGDRLDSLAEFCRKARIDDVMFIINGEELNRGHLSLQETEPWMKVIARGRSMLEPLGVTVSINPWTTLLHSARGRTLREGQNFRLMTDPYGNRSSVHVCPLCHEWRKYIKEMYAYYAELHPHSLWLEDDFRFHNHRPLVWGGCFCDEHLREFARRSGVSSLDREVFVRGLLQTGVPHDYRRIWLDSCRETLVELAGEIEEVVHRVSPETRIGLMTSYPQIHAAEGRDWQGIFTALSGNGTAFIRPSLPAYSEDCGFNYWWKFNAVSRLTAALIPEHTEIFPELENVPYSLFSKSRTFQKFQLETALVLGSRGITMNIFEMTANGDYPEERNEEWLSEEKDFLNSVAGLGLHANQQQGVVVLVDEKSAYTLYTAVGDRMEELYPNETFWASLLSAFGISNRFSAGLSQTNGVLAVSGQMLRNWDETVIRNVFGANLVLLEGDAAWTLMEMGLGSLCGIKGARWHRHDSGFQAYEQIAENRIYAGVSCGRMSAHLGQYLEIEYEGETEVIANVCDPAGMIVGPGITIAGGRVLILPYGQFADGAYQSLLNPIRREVIRETLLRLAKCPPLMTVDFSPHISVYDFESDGKRTVTVVNSSLDPIYSVELGGAVLDGEGWVEYCRDNPHGKPAVIQRNGRQIVKESGILALSLTVFHRA